MKLSISPLCCSLIDFSQKSEYNLNGNVIIQKYMHGIAHMSTEGRNQSSPLDGANVVNI